MTREEFLEYRFEGYGQLKGLWDQLYDAEAEWRRYREIQDNNARYMEAARRIKAARPGISDGDLDRAVRQADRRIRFDLPAADTQGRLGLFHLRKAIEERLAQATAAKDSRAASKWKKALAEIETPPGQGAKVPLPPLA
jgi:hypothetical protein